MTTEEQYKLADYWEFERLPDRVMKIRECAKAAIERPEVYGLGYYFPVAGRLRSTGRVWASENDTLPLPESFRFHDIHVKLAEGLQRDPDAALLMAERIIEAQWPA